MLHFFLVEECLTRMLMKGNQSVNVLEHLEASAILLKTPTSFLDRCALCINTVNTAKVNFFLSFDNNNKLFIEGEIYFCFFNHREPLLVLLH